MGETILLNNEIYVDPTPLFPRQKNLHRFLKESAKIKPQDNATFCFTHEKMQNIQRGKTRKKYISLEFALFMKYTGGNEFSEYSLALELKQVKERVVSDMQMIAAVCQQAQVPCEQHEVEGNLMNEGQNAYDPRGSVAEMGDATENAELDLFRAIFNEGNDEVCKFVFRRMEILKNECKTIVKN